MTILTEIFYAWISTTSATTPDVSLLNGVNNYPTATVITSGGVQAPTVRINVTTNTTVYLSGYVYFTSGTVTACGGIYARRVR